MDLELEDAGELVIIRLPYPRFTLAQRDDFMSEMISIISRGYRSFILDLSAVTFIDSSALSTLISMLKTIGPRSRMVVCGLNEAVEYVFRLTNLHRVIEIQPDVAHARKALQSD
ncbi:STAS domain-containing protein [Thiocapsa rosea]|uniref:Anti-sigma B factor antagonist n=1 Tax=Thiocapsa rosea TaxID=69360 RepID=A0A495VDY7_9GAMM|nr:STAS domain-containing protein [Thiocapsa rosea]RKT46587.1 anti-sigma B factor antagonist [Thiocapsa rosea]